MSLVVRQTRIGVPVAVLNPPSQVPIPPTTSSPPPPTTSPPLLSADTTTPQSVTPLSINTTNSPAQSPFTPSSINSLIPSSVSSLQSVAPIPMATITSTEIIPSSLAASVASSTRSPSPQIIITACVGGVLVVVALIIVSFCCFRKKGLDRRVFRQQGAPVDLSSADVEDTPIMTEKQNLVGVPRVLQRSSSVWLPPTQSGLQEKELPQPPSSDRLAPFPPQFRIMDHVPSVLESITGQSTMESVTQVPSIIQQISTRPKRHLPMPPGQPTTIQSSIPKLIRFASDSQMIILQAPTTDHTKAAQTKEDSADAEPPRDSHTEHQLLMTLMHRFDALEAAIRGPIIGPRLNQVPFHGMSLEESPPSYVAREERDTKETRLAWDGRELEHV